MAITDYHDSIRDAIVTVFQAALTAESFTALVGKVVAVDTPDDMFNLEMPCVGAACVGPEQDRPDWGTSNQDGIGYPVAIALLAGGTTRGEKTPGMPSATQFRRLVRTTFHNKRLSGVAQVGYCEVSDSGELWDPKNPKFQKLETGMVITAVGRFPRS